MSRPQYDTTGLAARIIEELDKPTVQPKPRWKLQAAMPAPIVPPYRMYIFKETRTGEIRAILKQDFWN